MTDSASVQRFLTADEITAADDRPVVDVEVAEWGGWVRVRALSLDSFLNIKEQAAIDGGEPDERMLTKLMLEATLVDEDGDPLFPDATELLAKGPAAIGTVLTAVGQASGTDKEALKEIEAQFRVSGES